MDKTNRMHTIKSILLKFSLVVLLAGYSVTLHAQGNFSYSCLIDGKPFSASGAGDISNSAFKTAPDIINFVLVSTDPKYKSTVPPQLAFYISPNGTTTIKGGGGKYTSKYSPASQLDNDYVGKQVVVTITSLTPSRITGTFSGKFVNAADKVMQITDGKFDLPASKYSKPLK